MLCSAPGKKRSQPDTDSSNGVERLEKIGDTTGNGTKGGKTKQMQEIYTCILKCVIFWSKKCEVCYSLSSKSNVGPFVCFENSLGQSSRQGDR